MSTTNGNLQLNTRELTDNIGTTAITTYNSNMTTIDTAVTDLQTSTITEYTFDDKIRFNSNSVGGNILSKLEGRSLVNVADNGVDYGNWALGSGITASSGGLSFASGINTSANLSLQTLEASSTYTIFYETIGFENVGVTFFFNANEAFNTLNLSAQDKTDGVHSVTLTTKSTFNTSNLRFDPGLTDMVSNFRLFGIVKDDQTSLDITQSLPFGISSVGDLNTTTNKYEIELLSQNQNLWRTLNINDFQLANGATNLRLDSNGDIAFDAPTVFNRIFTDITPTLKSGTQYTISIQGDNIRAIVTNTTTGLVGTVLSNSFQTVSLTFTPTSLFTIRFENSTIPGTSILRNVMLEENTSFTNFIAHQEHTKTLELDESLRSVGTVKDTLEGNEININTNEVVFDGSTDESWSLNNSGTTYTRFTTTIDDLIGNRSTLLSNRFNLKTDFTLDTSEGVFTSVGDDPVATLFLDILNTKASTVSALRTWLGNNNTVIQYIKKDEDKTIQILTQSTTLQSFENGTWSEDTLVPPTSTISVPENEAGQRQSNTNAIKIQDDVSEEIHTKIIPLDTIGNKNYIINGNFDIWQRGTSFNFTTGSNFSADRWDTEFAATGGVSLSRISTDGTEPFDSRYYINYNRTSAIQTSFKQVLENGKSILGGKIVTLSFWAKSSSDITNSVVIDSISQDISITTNWQKFKITSLVPFANDNLNILLTNNTTVTSIDFAQVKLEIGSVATPFTPRTEAEELNDCQRYFIRYNSGFRSVPSVVNNGTTALIYQPLPVKMRTSPSTTLNGTRGTDWSLKDMSDVANSTGTLTTISTDSSVGLIRFTGGTYTANTPLHIDIMTTSGSLDFSAEL